MSQRQKHNPLVLYRSSAPARVFLLVICKLRTESCLTRLQRIASGLERLGSEVSSKLAVVGHFLENPDYSLRQSLAVRTESASCVPLVLIRGVPHKLFLAFHKKIQRERRNIHNVILKLSGKFVFFHKI